MIFLLYALLGSCAGLLAGLFGIGGGLIIVPALIFSFKLQGLPPEILTHMAIGTSFASIVFTSLSSTQTHHKKRAVKWSIFLYMAPGILIGVWLGSLTVSHMKGETLQLILGLFVILISIKMLLGLQPSPSNKKQSKPLLVIVSMIIGWKSALLGIGGGILSVTFLRFYRLSIRQAVGTSAACGLPIAVMGTISNIILGSGQTLLPKWSSGFVYWPAFSGIVLTSVFFARLGARLAHHFSTETLQKCFAVFLLVVGANLLWPLL
ncbi:MAG: sulfite exporter TauE/SafE family protein [Endozoicomonas sp. (ex Botrylloides leachii)]|nr:sulfite exporter TauE/SafE family protein [Endozoicomonas sp. (ex Botrylloides leachii)]